MSISERVNLENLNIHQFQEVPESKREPIFDTDRDVGRWKQDIINDIRTTHDKEIYTEKLQRAKIFWPNEELDDGRYSNQELLEELNRYGNILDLRLDWIVKATANLAIARPGIDLKMREPSIEHSGLSRWDMLNRQAQEYRSKKLYGSFVWTASRLKIIDPNFKFDITEQECNHIKEHMMEEKDKGHWMTFVNLAANLRLVDADYSPRLTPDDMNNIRTDKVWSSFSAGEMESLKILAANNVKVIAPGVIMFDMSSSQNLNSSTPSMPEQRKF